MQSLLFASFDAKIVDADTNRSLSDAQISDSSQSVKSLKDGTFSINSHEKIFHIKAYGYRPFSVDANSTQKILRLHRIKVKALYLNFWGASNHSQTSKNVIEAIKKSEANAIVVDMKNAKGSTLFLTTFQQANSYGAQKNRTNRDIGAFMKRMKKNHIYTIARIAVFKDDIQASHNQEYAIKRDDNGSIWRNADNMAWVDPFSKKAQDYTIRMAEEAAKVGFDEINFDYIRFPAKKGLRYKKSNTQKNRIEAISHFLERAKERLLKYGVFISVDTYGNICWSKDDNGIGQTVASLAKHVDYLAPMLYPSCFSCGSFSFHYPADHPYDVVYRSIKHIADRISPKRVRPWLQGFRDYKTKKRHYKKFEITEQIKATQDLGTNGWMLWSPSSKYNMDALPAPSQKKEPPFMIRVLYYSA